MQHIVDESVGEQILDCNRLSRTCALFADLAYNIVALFGLTLHFSHFGVFGGLAEVLLVRLEALLIERIGHEYVEAGVFFVHKLGAWNLINCLEGELNPNIFDGSVTGFIQVVSHCLQICVRHEESALPLLSIDEALLIELQLTHEDLILHNIVQIF